MTFTTIQKTALAKLMATENLTVEHQKIQTAKFDPLNRILYLPIWQNMSGHMYDLLTGHEVGHALYTPPDGWHDAASDESKDKFYKNFLNVVEDARIEKKIQRRYPGLRNSFTKAYAELMKRDFFGINGKDVNALSFIDRLNLFTKSQYTSTWIQFSAIEDIFIEKVKNIETWDDVIRVTDEIYNYSKEEQSQLSEESYNLFDEYDEQEEGGQESDGNGYDDGLSFDNPEGDGSTESKSSQESVNDNVNSQFGSNETQNSSEQKTDNEFEEGLKNRNKDSKPGDVSPRCTTDENFHSKESNLLDQKSKEYVYVDIPKPKMENIVTGYKRVQELLSEYYGSFSDFPEHKFCTKNVTSYVNEFKNKNERYVSLLAKEFEMRKAAKTHSKSKLSDTGDIDVNKLSSYKFDDNIFRKVMMVPKGKNHGLILLLDKSGSMNDNMSGSIEQILVLSMFCRKVNIPFHVYGFGDSTDGYLVDRGYEKEKLYDSSLHELFDCFDNSIGNLDLGSVRLREYLSSKMSNIEFSRALRNMICLKKVFENTSNAHFYLPTSESLSSTPLTQAIVATATIMKIFKKQNNLDMTSLVIVHDGDADYTTSRYIFCEEYGQRSRSFSSGGQNVLLVDRNNKIEITVESGREKVIDAVLNWFKLITGSKVFGFFLVDSRGAKSAINNRYSIKNASMQEIRWANYYQWDLKMKELTKSLRKEKFISSEYNSYNKFFIVLGGSNLNIENEEIDIGDGKFTASKLKTAFMKYNKSKSLNRVLVSQFIQGIAA